MSLVEGGVAKFAVEGKDRLVVGVDQRLERIGIAVVAIAPLPVESQNMLEPKPSRACPATLRRRLSAAASSS